MSENKNLATVLGLRKPAPAKRYANGGQIPPEKVQAMETPTPKPAPAEVKEVPVMKAKPKIQPIKQPKMASSGVFKTRMRDELHDEEAMDHNERMKQEKPVETALEMLAKGGLVEDEEKKEQVSLEGTAAEPRSRPDTGYGAIIVKAEGGVVEDPYEDDTEYSSMTDAIMARRKKMAQGGMVDLEANEAESSPSLDPINEDAALKENYDDEPSFEKLDKIAAIRQRMKARLK